MKVIYEPSVHLVGVQSVAETGLADFLDSIGVNSWETDTEVGGEKLVECAGRTCYESFAKPRPGGNSAYIRHILEVGHGSVLEAAVFSLIFTGVSRSFTHELVRHRAGMSYSQLSQRFVDESGCAFVVPPALADEVRAGLEFAEPFRAAHPKAELYDAYMDAEFRYHDDPTLAPIRAGLRWLAGAEAAMHNYRELSDYLAGKFTDIEDKTLRRKKAREAARSVLPNATETKIFVTGNARALRHFLELRGDAAADAEIRRVAVATLRVLQAAAPNLFGDYAINVVNGEESTTTPFTKV